jgi:hypothetical protein
METYSLMQLAYAADVATVGEARPGAKHASEKQIQSGVMYYMLLAESRAMASHKRTCDNPMTAKREPQYTRSCMPHKQQSQWQMIVEIRVTYAFLCMC